MTIAVNGSPVDVPAGTTVAAAVMRAGAPAFRPLCGMGICFECRVTLNGRPHERSCQKSSQITHNAAAEGDHNGRPVGPLVQHLVRQRFNG